MPTFLLQNFLILWPPCGINQAQELDGGGPATLQRLRASWRYIDDGAGLHGNNRIVYGQSSPTGDNIVDL